MSKTIKLYHTSKNEIPNPNIHQGRKNADFGQGFYLTPDEEFTRRWAYSDAILNVYELDLTGLDIHRFTRDEDWFHYIFYNRRAKDNLTADVIIGPIANDTIFDTFGILSSGLLEPSEALRLLMVGPEYTQVAIKSKKALKQLHFIGSERMTRLDPSLREAEQRDYQSALAGSLE